jgi:hypothetical protein
MTRFDKSGKTRQSGLVFRIVGFDSFRVKIRKDATQGNLKIQVCLKHEKGDTGINESK